MISTRRNFLHGMGAGALVLGPLAHLVRAEAQGSFPLRVLFLFTQAPPTMEDYVWGPAGSIGTLPPAAQPLAAFKNQILPILGLVNSSGKFEHSHSTSPENVLTGHSSPRGTYKALSPSFDVWLDSQLTVGTTITKPSLRMRVGNQSGDFGVHWNASGDKVASDANLGNVFNTALSGVPVSGSSTSTSQAATVDEQKERRKKVFSDLQAEYALFSSRFSATEKRKIELHLESLRNLSNTLDLQGTQAPPVAREGCFLPTVSYGNWVDQIGAAISIGVTAMACDRTRFVTIDCGGGYAEKVPITIDNGAYGSTTVTLPSNPHAMNHSSASDLQAVGADGAAAHVRGQGDNCKLMHAVFARILKEMASVKEGDRTLLDNALVVMIPETYNTRGGTWNGVVASDPHSMERTPVLLGGSAGGHIKPGKIVIPGNIPRILDLQSWGNSSPEQLPEHSVADLWTMVANIMGYNITHYGRADWNRPGLKEKLS